MMKALVIKNSPASLPAYLYLSGIPDHRRIAVNCGVGHRTNCPGKTQSMELDARQNSRLALTP